MKIDFWLGNRGFSIGSGLWFNNGGGKKGGVCRLVKSSFMMTVMMQK